MIYKSFDLLIWFIIKKIDLNENYDSSRIRNTSINVTDEWL